MATFVKSGKKIRAQVWTDGHRKSKTLLNMTEAKAWAKHMESQLSELGPTANITFRELAQRWIARYPQRKSIEWEEKRLHAMLRGWFGDLKLPELTKAQVAKWRDERLSQVEPGTVLREWQLLSSVCTKASTEMELMPSNPFKGVKQPEQPPARSRVATPEEMDRLELCATTRPSGSVALRMFKVAIQTGMSVGELCRLEYEHIDQERRLIRVEPFKSRPLRTVPVTKVAQELLGTGTGSVFGQHETNVDRNWRNLCSAAAVDDLHFHDSRHMAASWMAHRIPAVALAKILGHRNLKMLLNVYYQEDPESLLDQLD